MTAPPSTAAARRGRVLKNRLFVLLCIGVTGLTVAVLGMLLGAILIQGWKHLDADFLNSFASRRPAEAGIKAALWGSVWLCGVCAAVAIPLGVGTAIFLEEYKPRTTLVKRLHGFVQLNITNLAGVPSIVYGILGLTVFVRMFGLAGSPNLTLYDQMLHLRLIDGSVVRGSLVEQAEGAVVVDSPLLGRRTIPEADIEQRDTVRVRVHHFTLNDGRVVSGKLLAHGDGTITVDDEAGAEQVFAAADVARYETTNVLEAGDPDSVFYLRLPLGESILAGGLTLALVILPIIIVASREALRAVPGSLREGAFALGSTRWQMISRMILPAAVPGIMTGSILAISRAIGEAAPLLIVGGVLFILATPTNLMSDMSAMPLQIYNWAGRPQEEFHKVAASGIIVLLAVLLAFNAVAIIVRQKFQRPLQ